MPKRAYLVSAKLASTSVVKLGPPFRAAMRPGEDEAEPMGRVDQGVDQPVEGIQHVRLEVASRREKREC
jgi:hypothetical protein